MEQKNGEMQVGVGLVEGRLAGQAAPAKQWICYDGNVSTLSARACQRARLCLEKKKARLEPHPGAESSQNLCSSSSSAACDHRGVRRSD